MDGWIELLAVAVAAAMVNSGCAGWDGWDGNRDVDLF